MASVQTIMSASQVRAQMRNMFQNFCQSADDGNVNEIRSLLMLITDGMIPAEIFVDYDGKLHSKSSICQAGDAIISNQKIPLSVTQNPQQAIEAYRQKESEPVKKEYLNESEKAVLRQQKRLLQNNVPAFRAFVMKGTWTTSEAKQKMVGAYFIDYSGRPRDSVDAIYDSLVRYPNNRKDMRKYYMAGLLFLATVLLWGGMYYARTKHGWGEEKADDNVAKKMMNSFFRVEKKASDALGSTFNYVGGMFNWGSKKDIDPYNVPKNVQEELNKILDPANKEVDTYGELADLINKDTNLKPYLTSEKFFADWMKVHGDEASKPSNADSVALDKLMNAITPSIESPDDLKAALQKYDEILVKLYGNKTDVQKAIDRNWLKSLSDENKVKYKDGVDFNSLVQNAELNHQLRKAKNIVELQTLIRDRDTNNTPDMMDIVLKSYQRIRKEFLNAETKPTKEQIAQFNKATMNFGRALVRDPSFSVVPKHILTDDELLKWYNESGLKGLGITYDILEEEMRENKADLYTATRTVPGLLRDSSDVEKHNNQITQGKKREATGDYNAELRTLLSDQSNVVAKPGSAPLVLKVNGAKVDFANPSNLTQANLDLLTPTQLSSVARLYNLNPTVQSALVDKGDFLGGEHVINKIAQKLAKDDPNYINNEDDQKKYNEGLTKAARATFNSNKDPMDIFGDFYDAPYKEEVVSKMLGGTGYFAYKSHSRSPRGRSGVIKRTMTPKGRRGQTPKRGKTPKRTKTPKRGKTPKRTKTPKRSKTPKRTKTPNRGTTPRRSSTHYFASSPMYW